MQKINKIRVDNHFNVKHVLTLEPIKIYEIIIIFL